MFAIRKNIWLFAAFLPVLLCGEPEANFPEAKLIPIYESYYLAIKKLDLTSDDLKIPNVKVYLNNDLSGKPKIELTNNGISVDGTIVCVWTKKQDSQSSGLTLREINLPGVCKKDIFPFVVSDDETFAEVRVWIIANSKETPTYFSATNNNMLFYIDKKTVGDFVSKKAIKSETKEKYNNNYSTISKFLKKNPGLKKLIAKLHTCSLRKDAKCLNIQSSNVLDSWSQYFCTNYSKEILKEFSSYCNDVNIFSCNTNGPGIDNINCAALIGESKPNSDAKLTSKNTDQKNRAEEYFWKELKSCFIINSDVTRISPPKNKDGSVAAETDENYRIKCVFSTLDDKAESWELESLTFKTNKTNGEPTPIYFDSK